MAGAMTVHKETRTYTGNRLNPVLMHVLASEQESQRPLLTPDEALRLPADATLVFQAGHRPIFAEKVRYYDDPPAPRTGEDDGATDLRPNRRRDRGEHPGGASTCRPRERRSKDASAATGADTASGGPAPRVTRPRGQTRRRGLG